MLASSKVGLEVSCLVLLAHVFRSISICSYISFKWCHGLVCNLSFLSRAQRLFAPFQSEDVDFYSRIGLGFSVICFLSPCFSIFFVF